MPTNLNLLYDRVLSLFWIGLFTGNSQHSPQSKQSIQVKQINVIMWGL